MIASPRQPAGQEEVASGPSPASRQAVSSPLAPLAEDLQALRVYLAHYVAARADAVRLRIRKVVLWAILGLVAAVAGMAALVMAVVLLLLGIADGLTVLLGHHSWAGEMLTGGFLLVLVGLGGLLAIKGVLAASFYRTKEKYERRRHQQHEAIGQDVAERAAGQPGRGKPTVE